MAVLQGGAGTGESCTAQVIDCLVGVFVVGTILIISFGLMVPFDITLLLLLETFVVSLIGIGMVWRLQNDGTDIKRSQMNINRAIATAE